MVAAAPRTAAAATRGLALALAVLPQALGLGHALNPTTTTTGMGGTTTTDMMGGTTTTGGMTTTTPEPVTIEFQLTIANVNYDDLMADVGKLNSFKMKCKESIAATSSEFGPEDVQVTLSEGSVIVDALITLPPDATAASATGVSALLTEKLDSGELGDSVISNIQTIPGIDSVTSGALSVTHTAPVLDLGGHGGSAATNSLAVRGSGPRASCVAAAAALVGLAVLRR